MDAAAANNHVRNVLNYGGFSSSSVVRAVDMHSFCVDPDLCTAVLSMHIRIQLLF